MIFLIIIYRRHFFQLLNLAVLYKISLLRKDVCVMRISPINNVYQNYNNSFKSKQNAVSKIANKALLPTAVCAYIMSPMLGLANQSKESDDVQYKKEFVMDNKRFTMTYVNSDTIFGENAVTDIYFTPKGQDKSLRLEGMTKYVSDEDYNVSVTVSESDSVSYEMRLPKKIGDELLKLYDGKTDFFVIPGFNTYSEINCKGLD